MPCVLRCVSNMYWSLPSVAVIACADVVAECHRAHEPGTVDAEASRRPRAPLESRRSQDATATADACRRSRRMREDAVGERRLHRTAADGRSGDRADLGFRHMPVANWIANLPGGRSEPEIIAASVSRIMNFVFSTTGSGSGARRAPAMNVLSVVITSLTSAASATHRRARGGTRRRKQSRRADCSNLRRLTLK